MPKSRDTHGQFTVNDPPQVTPDDAPIRNAIPNNTNPNDTNPKGLNRECCHLAAKICFGVFVFVFVFGAFKNSLVRTTLSSFSLNNVVYSAGLINSWICPEPEHDFCTKLNSLRSVIATAIVSMPEHVIKKYASSFQDAFNSFAPTCKIDNYRTTTASEVHPNGASANLTKDATANKTDSWWP